VHQHHNRELYRIDGIRRDRRWRGIRTEVRIIAGFALVCAACFFLVAEVLRVFLHFDDLPMLWPLCWFFLVLGYWLGRSGMRNEMDKD
jgi:FtsH-binding integral membrane protein